MSLTSTIDSKLMRMAKEQRKRTTRQDVVMSNNHTTKNDTKEKSSSSNKVFLNNLIRVNNDDQEKIKKSAYELAREERLRNNKAKMIHLGLVCSIVEQDQASVEMTSKTSSSSKKKTMKQQPTRNSKRVRGLNPEGMSKVEEEKNKKQQQVKDDKERKARLDKLVAIYGKW